MTSIIKLHSISGAAEEAPHCYLLQVDEFRFLLDCGWDEKFNLDYINEVKKHVNNIDAVLISYPDCLHMGALPYLVGKCNLSCPVYATIPIYKMGQMFMYDLYQSHFNCEDFELFSLDDVDSAFDKLIQVKYNQNINLTGKGLGISITPLQAGHMIGGTIWKIVKDDEEDIIYAVDFNHRKERHLNGCVLDTLSKPSLLITDALNATYNQKRRRERDEQLMTNILQTLRGGGNVLVAVDSAGRVLELAHMVDQLWRSQESGLLAYSLALLNNVSYNVVEFAKSQIEWMSDKLMKYFEGSITRSNPFQFKHLQLCHTLSEVNRVPEPKVVLASLPDLECGYSRDIFLKWCENSKNSIILTQRTSPGTLARELIDNPKSEILLTVKRRVRLEGSELEEYIKKEKQKKAHKEEEISKEDSDDSEEELEFKVMTGKGVKHDLVVKPEVTKTQTGFFKSARKTYPMYPFFEEKVKVDEYGEIVQLDDYKIVEPIPITEIKQEPPVKQEPVTSVIVTTEVPEMPTKCVVENRVLKVECQVTFIDFEGRSDGESIKKLLDGMKPRRVIIVRGGAESVQALADYCRQGLSDKVFIAKHNSLIDATTESHIYQVRLQDSLVSSMTFSNAKTAEVSWVDGYLSMQEEENQDISKDVEAMDVIVEKPKKEVIPILKPLSSNNIPGHNATFINEMKLWYFKEILNREKIPSEFYEGVLWCYNGTVALRRHVTGNITIEGCLSDEYYKVRELLYSQYAIV